MNGHIIRSQPNLFSDSLYGSARHFVSLPESLAVVLNSWEPPATVLYLLGEKFHLFATGFPLAAPIPPLTLFDRQVRILCLRHRGAEDVQTADVLWLSLLSIEVPVHSPRILTRELGHAANSQEFQIPQHGRTDRHEVL